MKKEFSNHWIASKQTRKQRKYKANAPLHIRHRMLSSNLSKDLRKKYGKRSFPVRKGDSVKIMSGAFKKKTGKVDVIDLKKLRVSIEGIQRTKKDGTKIHVWFSPSKLQIKELNLDDRKRIKAIQRKTLKNQEKKEERQEKKEEKKSEEKKAEGKKEDSLKIRGDNKEKK